MTTAVDLTSLREITGGDVELERELFTVFISSSTECLSALQTAAASNNTEEWRKQAHAWKGISYNLGAQTLGNLCKNAQDHPDAPTPQKLVWLQGLADEFGRVKTYLDL